MRWPNKPWTWKPTDTKITIAGVDVSAHAQFVDVGVGPESSEWSATSHEPIVWKPTRWEVTLEVNGSEMVTSWQQGSAHHAPPTALDVLGSVFMDAQCGDYSFEEFCSNMGYDEDSRKAEAIWRECGEQGRKLRNMLGLSTYQLLGAYFEENPL